MNTLMPPRWGRALALSVAVAASGWASAQPASAPAASQAAELGWQVAGHQGLMRFVIVPADRATDRDAYAREIEVLCQGLETCFLNFYTNTTGAPVALPLPDAIDKQATAVFRRSAKQGSQAFQWSCRMATTDTNCF